MEGGVEGSDVIDSTHSGYGSPIDAPIASPPLYSGAEEYFITYDIVRGSAKPVGRLRAAIYKGNMVNARDLEEDAVDLCRKKIIKGKKEDRAAQQRNTATRISSDNPSMGGFRFAVEESR